MHSWAESNVVRRAKKDMLQSLWSSRISPDMHVCLGFYRAESSGLPLIVGFHRILPTPHAGVPSTRMAKYGFGLLG